MYSQVRKSVSRHVHHRLVWKSLIITESTAQAKEGQTIIDVGINVNAEGKLCGDVDYAAVEPIVDAITPVPGGVGSVTTSVLVGHVVEAAMRKVNA